MATESDMVTILAFAKMPHDAARVKNSVGCFGRSSRSVAYADGFVGARGASVKRKVRALDGAAGQSSITPRSLLRFDPRAGVPMEHGFDDAFKARGIARSVFQSGRALDAHVPAQSASNGDAGNSGLDPAAIFTAGKPHIVAPRAEALRRRESAPGAYSKRRAYFLRASQSASSVGESFAAISS
ncbi:hypothetical protein [Caballeronia sp. AZ7_KS35]|uniref:hypothetical protein n=1 Tax=Caballeronia sp. AZ7_KS35 TaxID=2921762 RepID=UPI0020278653|nr:hypothetical protein [Caballeronia sp. AZ7_KS35]